MSSFYGKMFSTLGYKSLKVIFDVDDESLTEEEKKQLVQLTILMEEDADFKAKVDEIIISNMDNKQKLTMLFSLNKFMDRLDN